MPPIDPSRIGSPMGSPLPRTIPRAANQQQNEAARIAVSQGSLANTVRNDAERLQLARDDAVRAAAKEAREAKEFSIKIAKEQEKQTVREPIKKMLDVIQAAADGHRRVRQGGLAGSAPGRAIGQYIPLGTSANDLAGDIETVTGNAAVDTLMQVRQESPTGGAFGNVSDKDIDLLRALGGSFKPGQSNKKLLQSFETTLDNYKRVLFKIPGGREAFREFKVKWLGYDPDKKRKAANTISPDVDDILKQYGVK